MNDEHKYDDIIDMERPRSERHPPMPRAKRAAQFSPFAALTGYEDCIAETGRPTEAETPPDEETVRLLNERFALLADRIGERPKVRLTVFRRDEKKPGGAYVTVCGEAKKLDTALRTLTLVSGETVPLDEIRAVEGALFGETDADVSEDRGY